MSVFFYDSTGAIVAGIDTSVEPDMSKLKCPLGTQSIFIDDTKYPDIWNNQADWKIQNGVPVNIPVSDSIKLSNAQSARLTYLTNSFNQAIMEGFSSSADGTARTYAIDPVSMGKWTGTLSLINSGQVTSNIQVKDISGTKVILTVAQFKQFALDGFNYFNSQEQNLWAKEVSVESATTIADVNAVTY